MPYSLAIDIGASSGRHLIGEVRDGKLIMEEIYRFENGMKNQNGTLIWDIDELFTNIVEGLKRSAALGKIPSTVAIDTWGVDYVLLDGEENEILPAIAYRDSRTQGVPEEVFKIISKERLYQLTGIQKQNYNTIFQLYCDKKSGKLDKACDFLLMPEYLSYKLTGVKKHEYTISSTTGLLSAESRTWDKEIISALGLPDRLFGEIYPPSCELGRLREEIEKEVGFNCTVVLAPSHDTAAAVAACPVDDKSAFISSGTWSLVGTENLVPKTTLDAMDANLSNEGGINYRYRFLKNIMGMWLFQSIRRELNKRYTYDEMMHMAEASDFCELIDPTDDAFLAPESMIEAIRTYLGRRDLEIGDVLSSVYHSLAKSYAKTVRELEVISGKKIDTVAIVGGGCKDDYLNRLSAKYTGKQITAGPVECTAMGNLLAQLMYLDKSLTLEGARELVKSTFGDSIKQY